MRRAGLGIRGSGLDARPPKEGTGLGIRGSGLDGESGRRG